MRFFGIQAAVDSLRFLFSHLLAFAKLAVVWAVITTIVTSGLTYVLFNSGWLRLASLPPSLFTIASGLWRATDIVIGAVGNLAIAVPWIRYIVLGERPGHPFRFTRESWMYFLRSLQVTILAAVAGAPLGLSAWLLARGLSWNGSADWIWAIAILVLAVGSAVCAIWVYARLQLLYAGAAIGLPMTLAEAAALTRRRAFGLSCGFVLSYLLPTIPYYVIVFVITTEFLDLAGRTGAYGEGFVSELFAYTVCAMLAGFHAYALKMLSPRDLSGDIARQFE